MMCEHCRGEGIDHAGIAGHAYFDLFYVEVCSWCHGSGRTEQSYFGWIKATSRKTVGELRKSYGCHSK